MGPLTVHTKYLPTFWLTSSFDSVQTRLTRFVDNGRSVGGVLVPSVGQQTGRSDLLVKNREPVSVTGDRC